MRRLSLLALMACASLAQASKCDSFDWNWKFAKFGKFADCLAPVEPGAPHISTKCSSAEGHNPAANAFDGKMATRWCAANGSPAWVAVDFERVVKARQVTIDWEQNANYQYRLQVSVDGTSWTTLADQMNKQVAAKQDGHKIDAAFRYAKVMVKPTKGWASIREVTFKDAAGQVILPYDNKDRQFPYLVNFDDSAWRSLDLPHDWGVESRFLKDEPNETGKLPWNAIGWYRKDFSLPAEDAGKRIYVDFDGVMMNPQVYVNGQFAGKWAYGYNSFRIDITDLVKVGQENVIAVRAENLPRSTRWYPGAGIYRHVWLVKSNPVHVDQWGVFVHTPKIEGIKRAAKGFTAREVNVRTEITVRNTTSKEARFDYKMKLVAADKPDETIGVLGTNNDHFTVPAGGTYVCKPLLGVGGTVRLWDIEDPYLYLVKVSILQDGEVIDEVTQPFGIRKVEWKPDGFYLNDRRVQIKGVCMHHDLGALGSAVNTRAQERQLEILQSFGVNSIRTSHNPPAPEVLQLCDKMGILVDNELFDIWEAQKYDKTGGYHLYWKEWHEKDLRNFVLRDRNSPSVIAWSAGNEVTEQWSGNGRGGDVAEELHRLFKKYDPTRQTTVGCNMLGSKDNRLGKAFDVYGFNYKPGAFKQFAKDYPNRPFVSSESSSCVSSRGKYYFPSKERFWNIHAGAFAAQVSSYDLYAPGWAYRPDIEFAALDDEPKCAGEYVWTGFDYIGEPTPYNQDNSNIGNIRDLPKAEREKLMAEMAEMGKAPSRSSYFGIVDLCGFRKDRAYLYQAHWMPQVPMAHLLPHWNWVGQREGKVTPVFVYTSGDSAELFLNGKSLGKKVKGKGMKDRYRLCWEDVVYQPGTLEVVAYKAGKEWARDKVQTTGAATRIKATADRPVIANDGRDLVYVEIDLLDAKGRFVPTADNRFTFKVSGPFKIVGVCNGDATDADSMKGSTIRAFSGKAQVILQSIRGKAGKGTLFIQAKGLPRTTVAVESKPVAAKEQRKPWYSWFTGR